MTIKIKKTDVEMLIAFLDQCEGQITAARTENQCESKRTRRAGFHTTDTTVIGPSKSRRRRSNSSFHRI